MVPVIQEVPHSSLELSCHTIYCFGVFFSSFGCNGMVSGEAGLGKLYSQYLCICNANSTGVRASILLDVAVFC